MSKDFQETVRERAERDPEFRRALREEAVKADNELAKALIENCIKETDDDE